MVDRDTGLRVVDVRDSTNPREVGGLAYGADRRIPVPRDGHGLDVYSSPRTPSNTSAILRWKLSAAALGSSALRIGRPTTT